MKNTITEMRNTLERFSSRLDEAEGQISALEDKVAENTQSKHKKEKRTPQNEDNFRGLHDNIKQSHTCTIGVTDRGKRE